MSNDTRKLTVNSLVDVMSLSNETSFLKRFAASRVNVRLWLYTFFLQVRTYPWYPLRQASLFNLYNVRDSD